MKYIYLILFFYLAIINEAAAQQRNITPDWDRDNLKGSVKLLTTQSFARYYGDTTTNLTYYNSGGFKTVEYFLSKDSSTCFKSIYRFDTIRNLSVCENYDGVILVSDGIRTFGYNIGMIEIFQYSKYNLLSMYIRFQIREGTKDTSHRDTININIMRLVIK
ncbi:MAG: hypothetical protein SGJ10_04920 [Bacteroidota bacterium]|nr:hypothetical protein [Bacteroidota bacterium]